MFVASATYLFNFWWNYFSPFLFSVSSQPQNLGSQIYKSFGRQAGDLEVISKDVNDVLFFLYPDPRNLAYKENLFLGDAESVRDSSYNEDLSLIVLIHGFTTNSDDGFAQSLKNAYLETGFLSNIIAVDWGKLSSPTGPTPTLYYHLAVANVRPVAKRISDFILFLLDLGVVSSPSRVHVIGFSLGAHVAGLTGKFVNSSLGQPLNRVTGLDPAAPEFQTKPPQDRLYQTDARFVDVYHTNQGFKGFLGPVGHVDFMPNGGGPFQPGCSNASEFSDVFTGSCSHARAYEYFDKSIRNSSIIACKCDMKFLRGPRKNIVPEKCKLECQNPVIFGQFCPDSARGVYYLKIVVQGKRRGSRRFRPGGIVNNGVKLTLSNKLNVRNWLNAEV